MIDFRRHPLHDLLDCLSETAATLHDAKENSHHVAEEFVDFACPLIDLVALLPPEAIEDLADR